MSLKSLTIFIGISLLSGVITTVVFKESKYFDTYESLTEISKERFIDLVYEDNGRNKKFALKKEENNFELGALTAVSVFAIFLVLNGLIKTKKTTS
jgi:hypothetical protein